MISVDYVRLMARSNLWQNAGMITAFGELDDAALWQDRGAFFGSILATANHLIWADRMWLSRFGAMERPEITLTEGLTLWPASATWKEDRARIDAKIADWAAGLSPRDLSGDLNWYSGAAGRDFSLPVATCVTHMFNHQTHHRGQIHAMLTAAGVKPGATDLMLMPQDI